VVSPSNDLSQRRLRPVGKERIIVALDVPSLTEARDVVQEIREEVGAFKVGLELLTAEGSRRVVEGLADLGCRVFYDGKFNDIPNTIAGAARALSKLGVWMFDVHASSGLESLRACSENRGPALAVAVTVLTSFSSGGAQDVFGSTIETKVLRLATMAAREQLDGVVCSAQELPILKGSVETRDLLTVVPGIRPRWAETGDQRRVMTPGDAVRDGADYLVIGRPILKPPTSIPSRKAAAAMIRAEIEELDKGGAS